MIDDDATTWKARYAACARAAYEAREQRDREHRIGFELGRLLALVRGRIREIDPSLHDLFEKVFQELTTAPYDFSPTTTQDIDTATSPEDAPLGDPLVRLARIVETLAAIGVQTSGDAPWRNAASQAFVEAVAISTSMRARK